MIKTKKLANKIININFFTLITVISFIALYIAGLIVNLSIITIVSYILCVISITIIAITFKITKSKLSIKGLIGFTIGATWITLTTYVILVPIETQLDTISQVDRYNIPSALIKISALQLKPAIRTGQLGDVKIKIYSFDSNSTLPKEYGEIDQGKKATSVEFHAESSTGSNLIKSCYFNIVSKIDPKEDQEYNEMRNNISSRTIKIDMREMRCVSGTPNNDYVTMVGIVNAKDNKFKLKYYGDKVYYLDLN